MRVNIGRYELIGAAAITVGIVAVLSASGFRGDGVATAEPLGESGESSRLTEAIMIRDGLSAAAGKPVPNESGPFPRDFHNQILYALDRCVKAIEAEPGQSADNRRLQDAINGACNELLKMEGLRAPDATRVGDPYVPAKVLTDTKLQAEAKAVAARWAPVLDAGIGPVQLRLAKQQEAIR